MPTPYLWATAGFWSRAERESYAAAARAARAVTEVVFLDATEWAAAFERP